MAVNFHWLDNIEKFIYATLRYEYEEKPDDAGGGLDVTITKRQPGGCSAEPNW